MIDDTRLYLDEVGDFIGQRLGMGTIESHLVEHALIRICAAFEHEIQRTLVERCAESGDQARDQYVSSVIQRVVRSIRVNELSGILGGFDEDYKASYLSWVDENPQAATAYSNIVTNRHAVAHGRPRQATWNDVYGWWDQALPVITEFRLTLLT